MDEKMEKKSFAQKLKKLFSRSKQNDDFFEDLTDALIEGDVGAKTSYEIALELENNCKKKNLFESDEITAELKKILLSYVKEAVIEPELKEKSLNVWMVLGVNGVGKTTTVAKLANYFKKSVSNLVLASADTFRAAAIEQLSMHGQKIDVRVVSHQHGSDPSAVVFDAADAASSKGSGLVIADTAGRLHNKENLVHELQKIDRVCKSKAGENLYKKILVLDSTTGQNALRQAEVFNEAVGIDAVVLTKYDSTAKGGVAISIGKELGLPVWFVCDGEKYENIRSFNAEEYVNEFLGL